MYYAAFQLDGAKAHSTAERSEDEEVEVEEKRKNKVGGIKKKKKKRNWRQD